jgi:hypothetical protein
MLCQVSNVTLVECCWDRFYSSVESGMVKPVLVLVYFPLEPFREFPEVINELAVEVLNAPLNFTLILWIRRMSKMRFNAMLTAPVFPLLLKLRSMIRQNSLRKPALSLQNRYGLSRSQLMLKLLSSNNEPTIVVNAD